MSATRQPQRSLHETSVDHTSNGSILVALDGSPAANLALPIARAFARQLGTRIEVLHVVPAPIEKEAIYQLLHLTPEDLEGVEVRALVGSPAETILEMAHAPETQLIVLTTHGRLVKHGHRLGHVAEAVIAATNRPVLLIRPEAIIGQDQFPARIERMLFPLDGSPTTFGALRPAIDLACKLRAAVDLLYVVSPGQSVPVDPGSIRAPCYVDQPQHEWPQWSREATMRLIAEAGCPSRVHARAFLGFGDIESEVIRFATRYKEDIVVLVRRSHLEVGRARVLRCMLKHTPCPIFLLAARSPDTG